MEGARDLELAVFVGGSVAAAELTEREIVVGREPSCSIVVEDPSISRRHAALSRVGARVRVVDLGSANGTFVREEAARAGATMRLRAVRGEVEVAEGAVLVFGAVIGVVRAPPAPGRAAVVVVDPAMQAVHERLARAASSTLGVLLLGETGVGKEVLARFVHDRSPRAAGRFLALNCAALAPTLVESELFGHEKGAFTGAAEAKVGLLESANGGTVFLDEIGEMPRDVQAKLLRVLEERAVIRVGGRVPRPIDVRIVAATHRDLDAACRAGEFRQDLFFRLDGMSVTIPPLRRRPSEILPIARHFLSRASSGGGRPGPLRLSPAAEALLERHLWPGNVRELRSSMELAAVLSAGDEVDVEHLPDRLRAAVHEIAVNAAPLDADSERARVVEALARCDGNQSRAAELLGMSRRSLVSRLTSYGMTRPRKPGG